MEEKKDLEFHALSEFLTVIFNQAMPEECPDIELTNENRPIYFKIWCVGVETGMDLDAAIAKIKESDNA